MKIIKIVIGKNSHMTKIEYMGHNYERYFLISFRKSIKPMWFYESDGFEEEPTQYGFATVENIEPFEKIYIPLEIQYLRTQKLKRILNVPIS